MSLLPFGDCSEKERNRRGLTKSVLQDHGLHRDARPVVGGLRGWLHGSDVPQASHGKHCQLDMCLDYGKWEVGNQIQG